VSEKIFIVRDTIHVCFKIKDIWYGQYLIKYIGNYN
jgi:hypothetical protein